MAPDLVFIVPIRHHLSVSNWDTVKKHLAATLRSISRQTTDNWECRIVANAGSDLPPLPERCTATFIDVPLPTLPDRKVDVEAFYDGVRQDKGYRIYAGLKDIDPKSYVMVVDFDDFVSRNLAALVKTRASDDGWYFQYGYLYDGSGLTFLKKGFHKFCGTSHIVRRDRLGTFDTPEGIDWDAVRKRLGSHIFIERLIEEEGGDLQELPFPGAAYRISNSESTSGTKSLFRTVNRPRLLIKDPLTFIANLFRYRRLTPEIIDEFSLAD